MRSIMYHYIRDFNKDFPYTNSLSKNQFVKQVKYFSKTGLIKEYNEIFKPNRKIILTFDDGFKDHLYAAETLKKFNSTGIFFIPSLPYKNKDILDVHKVHLITSKVKGNLILKELKKYLEKNNIFNFLNLKEKKIFFDSYRDHNDDAYKKEFKKIMNYYGDIKLKHKVLNYLLKIFDINTKFKNFYLSKKELNYMNSLGMIIGSHAESHTLLSRLSYKQQLNEIKKSKNYLEKLIKKRITFFCYPYGGKKSYNTNTITILKKLNYKLAFSVGSKDITKNVISKKPYELPRYDCNKFI